MHSLFTSLKMFGIHQGNSASMQLDAYFNISSRVTCGGFLMEERDESSFPPPSWDFYTIGIRTLFRSADNQLGLRHKFTLFLERH